MKRSILFYCIVIVNIIVLQAQGLSLTIHVTPGKLKDAMTEEQMKTVTSLTLTGSLNDDDFSILRSGMPRLKNLDMENLEIETIPLKAFYNSRIFSVILPKKVDCIGDSAFYSFGLESITFSGKFPRLGHNILSEDYGIQYEISPNNQDLQIIGGSVYSSDGSILYLGARLLGGDFIDDGTRIIGSHAFEGCTVRGDYIYVPASVDYIKDYAFSNMQQAVPVRSERLFGSFQCESTVPPMLDEHVFYKENIGMCALEVPEESIDLYKSASLWNQFRTISAYTPSPPRNINSVKKISLLIENEDGVFQIKAEQPISLLELIDMEGTVFYSERPFTERLTFNLSEFMDFIFILRVTYEDGTQEIKRIIN